MMGHPKHDGSITAVFTDLYELTMAQAYHKGGLEDLAVFELFFRELPESRNFAMAAGLDDALGFLESFHFSRSDIAYLETLDQFSPEFLGRLSSLRFTGEVYAVPEGTVVFPYEPLLQVVAPAIEAQLVETCLLNQLHFQTVVASKCARVTLAADDRQVVDFGSRRAHGTDAALKVARASYLAGQAGTSNVLAGKRYGIPIIGTMAHSYIQIHEDESAAFEAFAGLYPDTTLLVDTYDTLDGVRAVINLAGKTDDFRVGAIRLDSGDLGQLAKDARRLLDEAGLEKVRIFASGGLDEWGVADLLEAGAPIDGFGVGTRMVVSEDAPSLDLAYKLVAYGGEPRLKLSEGKVHHPGRKQVHRFTREGRFDHDMLAGFDEEIPGGEPLLRQVMRNGRRPPEGEVPLEDSRAHAARQLRQLPDTLRSLSHAAEPYAVEISEGLKADFQRVASEAGETGD